MTPHPIQIDHVHVLTRPMTRPLSMAKWNLGLEAHCRVRVMGFLPRTLSTPAHKTQKSFQTRMVQHKDITNILTNLLFVFKSIASVTSYVPNVST